LKKDVEHCFNVSVTGISKTDISKVFLGFTEKIKPKEHKELKDKVSKHNPNAQLIIYSIQEIPFRLVYYPGLADKYIAGVKTTKGTFYTLPDFLKTTEKGLQPSLTNPFLGREDEIKLAKSHLLSNDILIITGSQGVGKSKLAVQLAEIFETELAFEPRVIASSPVPLWEDLNNFILPDKKYFIFGSGGAKALADEYEIPFLGEVPLTENLRECSDNGQELSADNQIVLDSFHTIAQNLAREISVLNSEKASAVNEG